MAGKFNTVELVAVAGYHESDSDTAGNPRYYGYLQSDGSWMIQAETSTGATRYIIGDSGYPTAWANRAAHTYLYFSDLGIG